MFFRLRLQTSFACIGIPANSFPDHFLQTGVELGKMYGINPNEAMIIVLAQMPMQYQLSVIGDEIAKLVHFKKINIDDKAIQQALEVLGFSALVSKYRSK